VKKLMMAVFILIMLLVTITCQSFIVVIGETQDVGFTIQTTVTFSNPSNGSSIWNFTEEDRTISLFMNNTWQIVHLINYSYPLETMKTDEDGNSVAVLLFPKSELTPGENMSYTITYHALSKPRSIPKITEETSEDLDKIPKDLNEKYCREEGPWLVNDPQLQKLAHSIAQNETKVLTIVKKFVEWINQNITYVVHEVPYYPNETYAERKGDCDDKAVLFVTLCRILGIPAYIQIGCIYLPTAIHVNETYWEDHVTSIQKRIGWHGWATVYVPPWGWLPVDLTYVMDGLGDPLNAIRRGAVTLEETIQYMNVTQTDYVASSRESRNFLIKNDFYVYMLDEMNFEFPQKPPIDEDEVREWDRSVPVVMVTMAIAATITGASMIICILHIRKVKKPRLGTGNLEK